MTSTSTLSKEIGRYVDQLLDTTDEINHDEAAEAFIEQHGDLLDSYVVSIIRRVVRDEIKKRSQVPVKPVGQYALFHGLPAAVTIAEGRTKPLRACTWDDLQRGRDFKVENIIAARDALKAYDNDLDLLQPIIEGTQLRVEDALSQVSVSA